VIPGKKVLLNLPLVLATECYCATPGGHELLRKYTFWNMERVWTKKCSVQITL